MRGFTYKFIKEQFNKQGYTLLSQEYKNNNQLLLIEKDGYKAYIKYANFCMNKSPSFFTWNNPFFVENIQTYIKQKSPNTVLLEANQIIKNKKKRTLIKCKCGCGNIFTKLWENVYGNTYCECTQCILQKRGKNHRKNKQEAFNFIEGQGYKILEKPENFVRNQYVEVENNDGYRGFVSYNRLLSGRKMAVFDIKQNKKNYIYNANVWAKNNNIKTIVLDFCDDKKWTRQGILCKCECGEEFTTSIASFQNGKIRCDVCSQSVSRYEHIVKQFLDDRQIRYIYQYRINSCKDILPLPFDFYLKEKQCLIEIDGEGHYKPCHFNQIGYEDSLKTYEITKKHDLIKDNYCKKYNIPLLRIPYWEIIDNSYQEKIIQLIEN